MLNEWELDERRRIYKQTMTKVPKLITQMVEMLDDLKAELKKINRVLDIQPMPRELRARLTARKRIVANQARWRWQREQRIQFTEGQP